MVDNLLLAILMMVHGCSHEIPGIISKTTFLSPPQLGYPFCNDQNGSMWPTMFPNSLLCLLSRARSIGWFWVGVVPCLSTSFPLSNLSLSCLPCLCAGSWHDFGFVFHWSPNGGFRVSLLVSLLFVPGSCCEDCESDFCRGQSTLSESTFWVVEGHSQVCIFHSLHWVCITCIQRWFVLKQRRSEQWWILAM